MRKVLTIMLATLILFGMVACFPSVSDQSGTVAVKLSSPGAKGAITHNHDSEYEDIVHYGESDIYIDPEKWADSITSGDWEIQYQIKSTETYTEGTGWKTEATWETYTGKVSKELDTVVRAKCSYKGGDLGPEGIFTAISDDTKIGFNTVITLIPKIDPVVALPENHGGRGKVELESFEYVLSEGQKAYLLSLPLEERPNALEIVCEIIDSRPTGENKESYPFYRYDYEIQYQDNDVTLDFAYRHDNNSYTEGPDMYNVYTGDDIVVKVTSVIVGTKEDYDYSYENITEKEGSSEYFALDVDPSEWPKVFVLNGLVTKLSKLTVICGKTVQGNFTVTIGAFDDTTDPCPNTDAYHTDACETIPVTFYFGDQKLNTINVQYHSRIKDNANQEYDEGKKLSELKSAYNSVDYNIYKDKESNSFNDVIFEDPNGYTFYVKPIIKVVLPTEQGQQLLGEISIGSATTTYEDFIDQGDSISVGYGQSYSYNLVIGSESQLKEDFVHPNDLYVEKIDRNNDDQLVDFYNVYGSIDERGVFDDRLEGSYTIADQLSTGFLYLSSNNEYRSWKFEQQFQ